MKTFTTDALPVHTLPIVGAVIRTLRGVAAFPSKVWEAHAFSFNTLSLIVAVVGTHQLVAVFSCVALIAHTFPIHTPTVVVALIRAGGHRAIWAFPSQVTEAAACVVLVSTVTAAACVYTFRKTGLKIITL